MPSPQETQFLAAVCKGNVNTVRKLAKQGVNVNCKKHGVHALHWATSNENAFMITALIEVGADINVKINANGITALHAAVHFGSTEIVALLIEKGISLAETDNEGHTALDLARKVDIDPAIVDMLEEATARQQLIAARKAAAEAAKLETSLTKSRGLQRDLPAPKPFRPK